MSEVHDLRTNIDTSWNVWYREAEDLARKVGSELKVLRITTYQQHRLNTPSETSSQYFKRTICIPFLDTFSLQLDERFSADNRTIQSLFSLVLKIIVSLNDGDIDLLVEKLHFWETHIISFPLALRNEVVRWKKYWEEDKNKDDLPDSLINALTYADPDIFLILRDLIIVGCTSLIGSCEAERSFSVIRRLESHFRSTMGEERLASLALMTM